MVHCYQEKSINVGINLDLNYNEILTNILTWLSTNGLTIAIVFLVAEVANHFAKRIISHAIERLLAKRAYPTEQDRDQRVKTLARMFSTGARISIWAFAVIIIVIQLGADVTAIVAGAGFLGLAFGIGAQSLIQDILTGMFIIIENQYRVGDIVELNGQSGEVVDITMRITELRDLDGNAHFIPNGEIKHSINMSIGFSKINMDISVDYDSDIDKVEKIINKTGHDLTARPEFGKYIEEAPFFARVDEFGESGIKIKVFGVVKPGKQWLIAGEYRRMLKKAFDKAGIEIPYPQVVVHDNKKKK